MTGNDELLVSTEGPVRTLTLNRPHALNALNANLGRLLGDSIVAADDDPAVRCIVVTGAGLRAFCAGGDLKEMVGNGPAMGNGARIVTRALRDRPTKPLIAGVNGLAYGGGLELVLACDLAVSSSDATFAVPEVSRGFMASGGGLVRLPRMLGPRRALLLALTGAPIDAATALEWGLVNQVVSPASLRETTMTLALAVAANAPLAVALSKKVLLAASTSSEDESWNINDAAFDQVRYSSDALEGPRAFAEKRPPVWTGA